jgi:hypothetical protein
MAVTAVSRLLPVHSLEFVVRVLGSWAVGRIVTAISVTGLLATGSQGAGHHPGLAVGSVSRVAARVQ